MTIDQIVVDAQIELDEITHGQSFATDELFTMFNQAYLEWCVFTKCITTNYLNNAWFAGPYCDFVALFPQAFGIITIFNQQTNRYLFDHLSRIDLDKIRFDWENWNGTPTYWVPVSHNRFAVAPHYDPSPVGLFDITVFESPTILTTGQSPVFASDMHYALTEAVVARSLESVEEFAKAQKRWAIFLPLQESFRKRVAANHNSEMRRIMGSY